MSRTVRVLVCSAVCLWAVCCVNDARADDPASPQERAAAQVLFDEARELSDAGDWDRACVKFEESMRLHVATGTQLNLARCYEQIGKLASAWINWVEAKQRATAAGQAKRAKIAADSAAALEGRISFITVRITEPIDDMVVERDGAELGRAQWDTKLPIDGGTHGILVTAPGHQPWSKTITVKNEGAHVVVRVPRLTPTPEPAAPKPPPRPPTPPPTPTPSPEPDPPPADDGVSGQLVAGIVFTTLGGIGLGLGIGFGVAAMNSNDESLTLCPEKPDLCTREGVDLRVQAFTFSYVSTGSFIAAGVATFTGIVLMAATPSDAPERKGVRMVPVPHGIGLGGAF